MSRVWLGLAAVLVVLVMVVAAVAGRPRGAVEPTSAAPLADGGAGLGDAYLPAAGGGGFDVQHYDVQVSATVAGAEIRGRTVIAAVANQDLDTFHLDLMLTASEVTVNGTVARIGQVGGDLAITATRSDPAAPAIPKGSTFVVEVAYAGRPGDQAIGGETPAYYATGREFVIAGEPQAAALWFPANDHPSDPATMRFSVSVPRGTEAICAGNLAAHSPDPSAPDADLWVWQIESPTVSYATFLGVGQFRVERGAAAGRPFVYAVSERLSEARQAAALAWLRGTPKAIANLERFLGPYPFSGIGGFVSAAAFNWAGLETAMRPVYDIRMVGSQSLLNHELAHMWLGNTVTLAQWDDIFDNESMTMYAQWLATEGVDPQREFRRTYAETAQEPGFWTPPLSDPGADGLFVRVYDRGPLVVQALRNRMGDDAFFAFLRRWAQQRGPRSLEQLRTMADDATEQDLTGFFAEWLDQDDRPETTSDNGFVR